MELWSEEFVSEINFSKHCSFDFHGDVINPKLGQKGPKLVFHVPVVIERWKSIVKGNLRWSICFWNHSLIILKFWSPVVMPSVQKCNKKVQVGISCTNVDGKMKIKSKKYFEVNHSFMKSLSQNFEDLTQRGDVINPKLTGKRVQTFISCTNGERKMKIKRQKNFEVRCWFMKLFSRYLEILSPCCDVYVMHKSGPLLTKFGANSWPNFALMMS